MVTLTYEEAIHILRLLTELKQSILFIDDEYNVDDIETLQLVLQHQLEKRPLPFKKRK